MGNVSPGDDFLCEHSPVRVKERDGLGAIADLETTSFSRLRAAATRVVSLNPDCFLSGRWSLIRTRSGRRAKRKRGTFIVSWTTKIDMSLLDQPIALLIAGVATIIGCALLWYGGRELLLSYRILTNDPSEVMSLGDGGPVEVEGTSHPEHGTLTSPFTGTECLAYEYEVKEERNSQHGTHWETIDSGRNHTAFRVEDETASALVDPRGADFRFSAERTIDVHGGKRPPERVQEFIQRNGDVGSEEKSIDLKLFELNTGKDRKYIEKRLDPGESVHVLGEARYDASAGHDAGEMNTVIGYGDTKFLISDTDERGAARRTAWKGLPYVLAGVLFFAIGGFVLGL